MSLLLPAGGATVTKPALDISFIGSNVDTTNTTTSFTFSSESIGTAAADRQIVVLASATMNDTGNISGVTVGGNTGTQMVQANTNSRSAGIYIASVSTGTTADIIISISGATGEGWGVGVYRVTGGASTTPNDTDSQNATTPDPIELTLSSPVNSGIIAGGFTNDGTNGTWANLTERYDEVLVGTNYQSGAFNSFAAAQTNLAVTFNADASLGAVLYVAASLDIA